MLESVNEHTEQPPNVVDNGQCKGIQHKSWSIARTKRRTKCTGKPPIIVDKLNPRRCFFVRWCCETMFLFSLNSQISLLKGWIFGFSLPKPIWGSLSSTGFSSFRSNILGLIFLHMLISVSLLTFHTCALAKK